MRPKAIGLFSGAGGLDIGLELAGFDVVVALDFDHDSCETLRKNFPNTAVLEGDIQDIPTSSILEAGKLKEGELDLLAGGPPCQPFSKSAFWNGSKGIDDPRAVTLKEYVRVLSETQPKAFLLENVFGLAYKNNSEAMDFLLDGFEELGYHAHYKVLNTANYGVPQTRERLIIVGVRKEFKPFVFPEQTHRAKNEETNLFTEQLPLHVTAAEAFEGLTHKWEEVPDELKVRGKWGHLLKDIPAGENYLFYTEKRDHPRPLFKWRSRYWTFLLKLSPDRPSWTIQAQPGPYVGPFHWENRRLTLAERKRIQTFPDDFVFIGKRGSVQRQIGNAVPAKFGQVLAKEILRQVIDRPFSYPKAIRKIHRPKILVAC
ncbi:MAG: DNA cytosine methyltransferase [Candidatus Peribacteraceae bacterium]|nr:DNA cytosine methyltransferase [Candidatus Peribacteraceae bacterium]MDD5742772.1 DNA cytosine methyltransferase [Candidatus Peribacteraceae bacterium]